MSEDKAGSRKDHDSENRALLWMVVPNPVKLEPSKGAMRGKLKPTRWNIPCPILLAVHAAGPAKGDGPAAVGRAPIHKGGPLGLPHEIGTHVTFARGLILTSHLRHAHYGAAAGAVSGAERDGLDAKHVHIQRIPSDCDSAS